MVEKFSNLNLKDNEIYLLGDFNINLFQNGKYFQIYSLKQLLTCPTRVTCNTSTLIDHILTNSTEKIFQSGIIYSVISGHQLIVCTIKVKRVKFHKHNNVLPRSLKHYTVNLFVEALRKVNF